MTDEVDLDDELDEEEELCEVCGESIDDCTCNVDDDIDMTEEPVKT